MFTRVIELHDGDELFCSVNTFDYKLSLGEHVDINKGWNIATQCHTIQNVNAIVTKIIKTHPNKKWWQFWIKQKILGYILRVVKEN